MGGRRAPDPAQARRHDGELAPLLRAADGVVFFLTHDLMQTPNVVPRSVGAVRPCGRLRVRRPFPRGAYPADAHTPAAAEEART